jgi:hypothetical protein
LSSNDTNSHDLEFCPEFEGSEHLAFTVEVKSDSFPRLANLCIEFECRGKSSGIAVTQADYYAYVFNTNVKEIWVIKTEALKEILHLNHKISTGGDKGSNTKMYLLDREKVREYFTVKIL